MFPPILNIPDLLSWCHSSLRLDNFHFDFELIELSHLFGLSFPHFFSVELLIRSFRRRLWSWRHWDPPGSQSQLIPLLHLETESLSRTFSSPRTATRPHLLSPHPCWSLPVLPFPLVNPSARSESMFCVGSCIGAVGLENGDGVDSCCITTVGCWSSKVTFAIDPTPAPTALELSLSFTRRVSG